jgi:hypothetical protein
VVEEKREIPFQYERKRPATVGMDKKQTRTESRRRLVSIPSNLERGSGWSPPQEVASYQDSRVWWRWISFTVERGMKVSSLSHPRKRVKTRTKSQ